MADFKTHITASTVVGVGYGVAGHYVGLPPATCLLATGLCSVAGMLPDLDSDSGVPLRESIAFGAAVVPMLMIDRLQGLGLTNEAIVLAGGLIYLVVRFGVAEVFRRYTVHRGMWHSLPAAAIAGMLTFLIASGPDVQVRLYKALAVVLGFMVHLLLDELWSLRVYRGRLVVKRSFGTAMKFWGKRLWANVSTYAKLIMLTALLVGDEMLMERYGHHPPQLPRTAQQLVDDAFEKMQQRWR